MPPLKPGQVAVTLSHCSKEKTELDVCFDSVVTDSRCPTEAVCVWQGQAIIEVSMRVSGEIHRFQMLLQAPSNSTIPGDTTIAGHHISFDALLPEPRLKPVAPGTKRTAIFTIR